MGGDEAPDGRQPPAPAPRLLDRRRRGGGPRRARGGQAVFVVRPQLDGLVVRHPVHTGVPAGRAAQVAGTQYWNAQRARPASTSTSSGSTPRTSAAALVHAARDRLAHLVAADARHRARPDRLLQPLPAQLVPRRDGQRLPPHRPGQGPPAAHRAHQARPAHRPHPDGHVLRLQLRPAADRRRPSPRRSSAGTAWASGSSTPSTPTTSTWWRPSSCSRRCWSSSPA